ncbi:MAG: glutamate-5-semialdehyde dehydrogenase [Acidobacteria bacterium]|nr:glutamate-5-semialdehyde dehydrogenase [Acidobacteriota bacterium]
MSEKPMTVPGIAKRARRAARTLGTLPTAVKNAAILAAATAIEERVDAILDANEGDLAEARPLLAAGSLAPALFERLPLDRRKVAAMAAGLRAVASLEDPAGRVLSRTLLDDGLVLTRRSVPLGVVAVVFESRPDAVPQISALAAKSGNAAILKGGREAVRSARVLVDILDSAFRSQGLPEGGLTLLTGRDEVDALLACEKDVDLVIPRGGNALVRYVQEHTRIPVLGHAEGICHVYVDRAADPAKAVAIAVDSKLQYPAACNAAEAILVHRQAAHVLVPRLVAALSAAGCEVRGCDETRALAEVGAATHSDFDTEFSAPVVAMKVVADLDEAIDHVNEHSSRHTDAIVTEDSAAAERFLREVDSAGVFHNASTRFADGFRYGLGAEVGISTNKLHARGPVGLEGLVTYRWELRGAGQIVATYSGKDPRHFRHLKL